MVSKRKGERGSPKRRDKRAENEKENTRELRVSERENKIGVEQLQKFWHCRLEG